MAGPELLTDIDTIDDLEFERRTLAAIRQELGLGGLARFLATYRSGPGDYTAERHLWLDHLTLEDIQRELPAKGPKPIRFKSMAQSAESERTVKPEHTGGDGMQD